LTEPAAPPPPFASPAPSPPPSLPPNAAPHIVVEVDYTLADWVESQRHLTRKLLRGHRWVVGIFWGILIGFVLLVALSIALTPGEDASTPGQRLAAFFVSFVPWAIVSSILFGLLHALNRSVRKKTFNSHPYRRHHTYVLDGAGVSWREPLSWGAYAWPAVLRWAQTKHLLLLHLGENSVIVLPRRCLGSQEPWAQWLLNAAVDQRLALNPQPASA
jgi:hypothetical protein